MESPEKIPAKVLKACESPANSVLLSLVSIWEMQIKIGLGKLRLKGTLSTLVDEQLESNSIEPLQIQLRHVWKLSELPQHHADPFDRLLVAQAQVEKLTLVTADAAISKYKINIAW